MSAVLQTRIARTLITAGRQTVIGLSSPANGETDNMAPYFAYIDKEGKIYKPFVLPQQDPAHYFHTFKSYNIPELSKSPLPFDAVDIKEIYLNSPAEPFK